MNIKKMINRSFVLYFVVWAALFFLVDHKRLLSQQAEYRKGLFFASGNTDFSLILLYSDLYIKINPKNEDAWLLQSHIYYGHGDYRKSLRALERAQKLSPNPREYDGTRENIRQHLVKPRGLP